MGRGDKRRGAGLESELELELELGRNIPRRTWPRASLTTFPPVLQRNRLRRLAMGKTNESSGVVQVPIVAVVMRSG